LLGVGALMFKRNSILLVKRGRQPLKDYWSLPGGLIETGETIEAAVQREVLEETGLRVQVGERVGVFERIMREGGDGAEETGAENASGRVEYHYVLVDHVCRVVGGALVAGDDVSQVAWIPRGELNDYQLTQGTQQVIEAAFDRRAKPLPVAAPRGKTRNARGKRS